MGPSSLVRIAPPLARTRRNLPPEVSVFAGGSLVKMVYVPYAESRAGVSMPGKLTPFEGSTGKLIGTRYRSAGIPASPRMVQKARPVRFDSELPPVGILYSVKGTLISPPSSETTVDGSME